MPTTMLAVDASNSSSVTALARPLPAAASPQAVVPYLTAALQVLQTLEREVRHPL